MVNFHNIVNYVLLNYMRRNNILHTVVNNYYAELITIADGHKAPVNSNKLASTRLVVRAQGLKDQ
jgi:hypothetical protein